MSLKYFCVIFFILLSFVHCDKYLKERPPFLKSCKLHDSDFSKCLASNFQTLFAEWKDGLPGLSSVGKLDPLLVKRVKILQDGSRALSLNMDLQNVLVSGASKAVVKDVNLDSKTWKIEGTVYAPKLTFDSDYKVKGNVLTLALNSAGKAKFQAENIKMFLTLQMELRDDGDLTFSEIKSCRVVMKDIGNFHLNIDNLFNGQKELEAAANDLFNQNWRELYESLRPAIEQTIGKVLEDRLTKIFHYVPASYFIADIPKAAEVYG